MMVCLEGLDGAGKSFQAERLADRLNARLWKFPNKDTPTGKAIYGHLGEAWRVSARDYEGEEALSALIFQSLQVANRLEQAPDILRAAARGNVVLDRYWPSGVAYGGAEGLDQEYLLKLHAWMPQPDLFLLLDIDPADSVARRPDRRDRYERHGLLMADVVERYRRLWATRVGETGNRCWVQVDGRGSRQEVADAIDMAVASLRERDGAS